MAKSPKRPNRAPKKQRPSKGGGREDSRMLSPETKLALERIFIATKKA